MTVTVPPTVSETYYPGTTLRLYSYPPPVPPAKGDCRYSGPSPRFPEIKDRYNKSIEERVTVHFTPPDVTITLEKRFDSNEHGITHVWFAQVQDSSSSSSSSSQTAAYPPKLVVKIYDTVWFAEGEWYDPFKARDLLVSREVESYRRFEPIQGTKVPRFYGHFVAPLPSQHNRTVHAILMQYIPGDDLRHILHQGGAPSVVCDAHKHAVHEAILNFMVDIDTFGVDLLDSHPRNVMVPPPKERREFCAFPKCLLRLEADWKNLELVMIDFDSVDFTVPLQYDEIERRRRMDRLRPSMVTWLKNSSE